MELIVKRVKSGVSRVEAGIIMINKTTITTSKDTIMRYGLKNKLYFGIGKRENGSLIAVFSGDRNIGLLKLSEGNKKGHTLSISLNGENRKITKNYNGMYKIVQEVNLMENAVCYTLKPIFN